MDTVTPDPTTEARLRTEILELRARLEEAEDTLRAIRMGEVDSLVVETQNGPQLFSLDSAEAVSNRLRGEILAQVTDAVGMIDNDERITYLNPALERLYRVQPGEMLGHQLSELYQRRWLKPGDEAAARATLREHGEAIWELIHITRDGRELHVQASVCLMRDATGHVTGIITAIRDVTERKLVEKRLREQEERERFAMRAAGAGAWDWDIGTGDIIWSPEAYVLYDFDPALGAPGYADWESRIHPDDRVPANAMVRDVVEGRAPEYRAEFRVVHRDGRIVWLLGGGRVQRDAAGKALRLSGINLDITARKRAEAALGDALAQAEKGNLLLTALMEHVPEGITIADAPDITIQMVSRAGRELTGKPREVIEGIPLEEHVNNFDIYRADGVTRARNEELPLTRAVTTGELVTGEEWILGHPDGRRTVILCNAAPVRDAAGQIVKGIVVWRDITALKQAEERLRTSEKQVRQVIDSMSTFVGMLAPDGTLVEANHAALAAAELTPSDVLGSPFWDCHWWAYDPAVQDRLRAGFDRAVRGEVVRYEETIRGVNDTRIIIDFMLQPVFDAGRLLFVVPSAQDITARKQAEETIARQVRELDALYTTSPTGLFQFDADLRFVRVNTWMAAINGPSVEAHIGRTVDEVLPPELAAHVERLLRQVLQTGEPILELEIHGTTRAQVEERDWLASYHPVRSADGAVVGVQGVLQDITARKQAEEELRRQKDLLRSITDTTTDLVYVKDQDHKLTFANPASLSALGLTESQAIGVNVEALYPDQAQAEAVQANERRILTGGPTDMVEEVHTGPHGTRTYLTSKTPIRDGHGAIVGLVGISRDITVMKQAERVLAERTELLNGVLEGTSDVIFVKDLQGRIVLVNAAFAAAARSTPEQLVGKTDEDWFPPDLAAAVRQQDKTVLAGGLPMQFEDTTPVAGEARVFLTLKAPLRDGSKRVVGILGIGRDITERKQAEAALRASEEFNRTVLESSPDCVKVLDAAGRVEFMNQNGLCLLEIDDFGARRGQPWSQFWPEAERPKVHAAVEQASRGETARFIAPAPTAKGNPRWWDVIVAPLAPGSGEGGEGSLISVSRDVTAQKAAEAELHQRTTELRESEARIRLATEATAVGIWEWDLRTHTLRWDAQMFRIYGIAPTTDGLVHYSDWSGGVLPEDLADAEHEFERAFENTVRRREFRIRRRDDGEVRHIDVVEALRMNEQGEAQWVVGTNLDVTERNNADRQLNELANRLTEADQRKDEFLATLAHELRNPLAPITNALALLRLATGGAEVLTQAREIMERQIAHMVRLTDDLLDVSRIGGNKVQLRTAPLELGAVIHHAVEAWQPHLKQSRHKFVLTAPSAPIHVHGDATRLAQVIGNLLTNASKYSDAGGSIWLTVQHESSEVKIIVRDTGIGIPPEMLDQIFHMFTQVPKSVERSDGGLGIGLWLVKHLVELHGGTVTAHSDGLGHGSEFTVRLPVLIDHARTDAPVQVPDAAPDESAGRRILVVDDNVDNVTTLAFLLTQTGHEVRTAYDGVEAIATAETFRPDVILLDIGLPKLNGHDTCRAIRKQPWGKDILIVALTGWSQEKDRHKSAKAGFDVHLIKPVDTGALNALLLNRNLRHGQTH